MNRQQFSEVVKDPRTLGEGTIAELQDMLRLYPYCQTAQILLAFNLLRQNSPAYQAQLKKAVAYAGDRKKLKEFLEVKKELVQAVPPDTTKETETETEPHTAGQESAVSLTEPAPEETAGPEISPSLHSSAPDPILLPILESASLPVTAQEPRQENYIEDSVISSEELELATPQLLIQEPLSESQAVPLPSTGKQVRATLEKMTQNELLSIVRKRLAEINYENKGIDIKQEKASPPEEMDNGAPVLKPVVVSGRLKDELIEKFIREEPQISRPKREFFNPTASAQKSNLDEEDIISETLALLYAKQGNLQKAIHIYEKLSLRFSEKSRYFAAQIENLKGNTSQSL